MFVKSLKNKMKKIIDLYKNDGKYKKLALRIAYILILLFTSLLDIVLFPVVTVVMIFIILKELKEN